MKLIYWVATQNADRPAYHLRAKTKKAVQKMIDTQGDPELPGISIYRPPKKVVVEYRDAFHLLNQCLGEGGIQEE